MKNELSRKIMTEFLCLRPNTSYSIDDGNNDKKAKGKKKCVIKQRLKFEQYKKCLLNNKIISKSQQTFRSKTHNVYTVEIKKQ